MEDCNSGSVEDFTAVDAFLFVRLMMRLQQRVHERLESCFLLLLVMLVKMRQKACVVTCSIFLVRASLAKNRDENANAVDCIPVMQAAKMRCLLEML